MWENILLSFPKCPSVWKRKRNWVRQEGYETLSCVEVLNMPMCCQPHGKMTGEGQIAALLVWLRRCGGSQRIGWVGKCKKKTFLSHSPQARHSVLDQGTYWCCLQTLRGLSLLRLCSLGLFWAGSALWDVSNPSKQTWEPLSRCRHRKPSDSTSEM